MKIRLAADASARFIAGAEPARDDQGQAVPVQPGEVVDVDRKLAKGLLDQTDVWSPLAAGKKGES